MKNILTIGFSFCNGIPGIDTIKGTEAKEKILKAANSIDRLSLTLVFGPSPIIQTIVNAVNTIAVPAVQSISPSKYYDKKSVEDCASKINSIQGLILGGASAQISCNVKEASFIDIGPINIFAGAKAKVNNALAALLFFGDGSGGIGIGTGSGTGSGNSLTPIITSFSPASGIVGTTVTIGGRNFSSTTSQNIVRFNGITATVTSGGFGILNVVVTVGTTTGPISVTVGSNTVTSSTNFTLSNQTH